MMMRSWLDTSRLHSQVFPFLHNKIQPYQVIVSSSCAFVSQDFVISVFKMGGRWSWMKNQRTKSEQKINSRRNLISHSFIYKRCLMPSTSHFLTIKWKLKTLTVHIYPRMFLLTVKIYLETNTPKIKPDCERSSSALFCCI